MCIWLPRWPLQRLAAARPELKDRAVLIYEAAPRGGLKVVDYSPKLAAAEENDECGVMNDERSLAISNSTTLGHEGKQNAVGSRQRAKGAGIGGCGSRELEIADSAHHSSFGVHRLHVIRPGMPLAEAVALAEWEREREESGSGGRGSGVGDEAARGARREASKKIGRHCRSSPLVSRLSSLPLQPLHLELDDPVVDRLALEDLAQWCQRFSPSVGVESGERRESLLLDITGLGRLAGGEAALAAEVSKAFQARGLTAHIAIADTIGTAWAVTRFQVGVMEQGSGIRGQGSGSRGQGSGDETIVPPGQSLAAIRGLPVEALRLAPEAVTLLSELGIRAIGQVAALGRSTLASRFGPQVLERLDQATGVTQETIGARKLLPELELSWDFEYPTTRREPIELALEKLIARLARDLEEECKGAIQIECQFRSETSAPLAVEVGLFRPSAVVRHLMDLIRLRLERLRLVEPVSSVRVAIRATGTLEFQQQQLFASAQNCQSPRQLAALVDRLSSRLGREAVVRPWLLADAQPEQACQYTPLAGSASQRPRQRVRQTRDNKVRNTLGACDRPLRLWPQPVPLEVVAVAPDGPPVQFRFESREERILCTWGPERIETGWWRSRCVRRDYYRVETARGSRFWLFRRLQDGRWFLQGEFE